MQAASGDAEKQMSNKCTDFLFFFLFFYFFFKFKLQNVDMIFSRSSVENEVNVEFGNIIF